MQIPSGRWCWHACKTNYFNVSKMRLPRPPDNEAAATPPCYHSPTPTPPKPAHCGTSASTAHPRPRPSGCHDCCTVRNTRSACGISTVKRPSGVVTEVMPPRRAVRVVRISFGMRAPVVDEAHRHQRLAEAAGLRKVGIAFAVGHRDRRLRAGHALEEDRRRIRHFDHREARLELFRPVAGELRPGMRARDDRLSGCSSSGSRCRCPARRCRRG